MAVYSETANEWTLFRVTVGIMESIDPGAHSYYVAALNAEHACKLVNQFEAVIHSDSDIMALEFVSDLLIHPLYMPNDDGITLQT